MKINPGLHVGVARPSFDGRAVSGIVTNIIMPAAGAREGVAAPPGMLTTLSGGDPDARPVASLLPGMFHISKSKDDGSPSGPPASRALRASIDFQR